MKKQHFFLILALFCGLIALYAAAAGGGAHAQEQPGREKGEVHSLFAVSPDSSLLAYMAALGDEKQIRICSWDGIRERSLVYLKSGSVTELQWTPDGEAILYLYDPLGKDNYHLFRTDLNKGITENLTPCEAPVMSVLPYSQADPAELLVLVKNKGRDDVYRISLKKKTFLCDTANPGDVAAWLADNRLQVRCAEKRDAGGNVELMVRDDVSRPWRSLMKWQSRYPFEGAKAFSSDNSKIFIVQEKGIGASAVFLADVRTGKKVEIFESRSAPINGMTVDPKDLFIEAASTLDRAHTVWHPLNVEAATHYRIITKITAADSFFITSRSADNLRWVVKFLQEEGAFRYYLYDCASRKSRFLSEGS
ncbi:MAG: hypothetical protein RDV48_25430 [Candidatus Eremiobacteraeota bacterium]|nr:hypothetical protein [Candidatus Eremiobacteraeota bacterium]